MSIVVLCFSDKNKKNRMVILCKVLQKKTENSFNRYIEDVNLLIENSEDSAEQAALRSFRNAVEPLLNNPSEIKSFLGKIQRHILTVAKEEFTSIEEIQEVVPENIKVILG
ncbi:hypothetical protein [Endozoicomonas sp. ALE010]|uniref:hypothetical protein n=1 Tax=Endozoicomonas sp. ALE010 TaxID=3403081 RepID=UPI003BB7467A